MLGVTLEELKALWRDEAKAALEPRIKGEMEIEIFKVIGERRVSDENLL